MEAEILRKWRGPGEHVMKELEISACRMTSEFSSGPGSPAGGHPLHLSA